MNVGIVVLLVVASILLFKVVAEAASMKLSKIITDNKQCDGNCEKCSDNCDCEWSREENCKCKK